MVRHDRSTSKRSSSLESDFIHSHGPGLVSRGYPIVPIKPGTKHPAQKGWLATDYNTMDLARKFHRFGVGVKTGGVVGVDIDVLDDAVVEQLVTWLHKTIGAAPVRVGKAPKALLAFRTSTPFRKKSSRAYRSPDGKIHRVEVLGKGQQFVAYAEHPESGRPYSWGDQELTDIPYGALTEISEKQVQALFDHFYAVIPKEWKPTEKVVSRADERHRPNANPYADVEQLEPAMAAISIFPEEYERWIKVGMALHRATSGSADGLRLWDEWSRKGEKYRHETEAKWKSFATDRTDGVGAATIFFLADEADKNWRSRSTEPSKVKDAFARLKPERHEAAATVEEQESANNDVAGQEQEPKSSLNVVSLADFEGTPVPERRWIVEGLVPDRTVTDLSGDGGTGKSLLALQLAIAMSAGRGWLGYVPVAGRVLYLSAEDELDELRRRAKAILARELLTEGALQQLRIADLTMSSSTELAVLGPDRSLLMTQLFDQVRDEVASWRPKLVILDTRADVFGGNEIDRVQVRKFVRALRHICLEYDLAVLMLSHPSVTGMNSGTGQSGSTAWGNSVRSRLYLERATGEIPDPDLRVLTTKKSNYASAASELTLRWNGGVFELEGPLSGKPNDRQAQEQLVERRFLDLLREFDLSGRHVNNVAGPYYAPKQFALADCAIGKVHFRAAMDRLFNRGRIKVEPFGPPSRGTRRIVEVA